MSAFQVSNTHIATVAAYNSGLTEAMAVAVILAQANADSVNYRYSHHGEVAAPAAITTDEVIEGMKRGLASDGYEIHKLARCIAYQSCEYPGWEGSIAQGIINTICRMAVASETGGWDEATEESFKGMREYSSAEWSI